MKDLSVPNKVYILLLTAFLVCSCSKKADEFSSSVPVKYYLSYNKTLSPNVGPDGGWLYITNYLYPESNKTCEWSTHLTHNITKGDYGYDLIFWSASASSLKVEYILSNGTNETVILSKILDISYINDSTAIEHKNDISLDPLIGTNPNKGKDMDLILRMTYNSGSDPIEIFFDGNTGTISCSWITLYEDK
jgi:hypothetical protein